jgi:hypothetical protein
MTFAAKPKCAKPATGGAHSSGRRNADDFMKLAMDMDSQQSAWLRQVSGYWNMAASLALAGSVNRELFLNPSCSGEMYFIFAKVKPFLKDLRQKMEAPDMFGPVEELIESSKKSRDFMKSMDKRMAERRKRMAGAAKAS